ncbi:hypothetical protein CAEBREN_07828 [Caenorhabditis brenneri]|uniref:Uncharacterized protein n=1 Tax=Caenorhabditis brenneri TaxID=135651 RepID=G0MV43_CAEBE|nr:hypothetical protein CAEBREN_07828 [Caenorhabditis brenneri]
MAAAHKNLLALWAKEPKDLAAVGKALNDLTIALSESSDLNEKQSALASKDLYEISVLLAILKNDFDSFDDYINQRKWHLDGERFLFEVEVAQEKPVNLDTVRIATQTIFYAKQLEQIV